LELFPFGDANAKTGLGHHSPTDGGFADMNLFYQCFATTIIIVHLDKTTIFVYCYGCQ